MFFSMVLSVFAVVQSVWAGYDYPKPSVPFELPNNFPLQDFGGQFQDQIITQNHPKTISYSIPYEDYQYLQQHKNENVENIIHSGSAINTPQQNLKISALQDLTNVEPITTELNANIDGAVSVQSAVVQSHVIREPDPINAQPILNLANKNQVPKIVVPSLNPQTTESRLLNNENIQKSNSLKVSSDVPLLMNIDNNVPNFVNVPNNLSPVLNLLGNNAPITNVQNTYSQPTSVINASPQLFNFQNTNHIDAVQHNQVPFKENYDIPPNTLPLQQTPQLFINQYGVSDITNFKNGVSQLSHTYNNVQSTSYQSVESSLFTVQNNLDQFSNAQNLAEPVITKHIYFHVPPPDIEETPVVRAPLSPKKIYKIVFIKLPAQESKNKAQLQAALLNQLAPIEDKTLIYVLVKKPELSQVVLPQPKVSEHEVLFVKYKGNPAIYGNLVDTIEKTNTFQNNGLTLQPGRVNGNK